MRQAFFEVRLNGLLLITQTTIIVFAALLVFHCASFLVTADQAVQRSFSHDAEVNLFSLVDTLADPSEFSEFRESPKSIDALGNFYYALNTSQHFTFLSIFNQAVPIQNFQGGTQFNAFGRTDAPNNGTYPDPESGIPTRNITSFQLNKKAFDFYHLEVSAGDEPDWQHVDYSTGSTSVLLGADYQGVYEIGDSLHGNLYFEPIEFKVSGFLKHTSSVYYHGNFNTFFDDALVIPYPPQLSPVTEQNRELSGILAFAMVNGDIAAPPTMTTDDLFPQLEALAKESKFSDFTLVGIPSYLSQLTLMRAIITENRDLIIGVMVATGSMLVIVAAAVGSVILTRRKPRYVLLQHFGHAQRALQRENFYTNMIHGLTTLVITLFAFTQYPNPTVPGILLGAGVVLMSISSDALLQNRLLAHSLRLVHT